MLEFCPKGFINLGAFELAPRLMAVGIEATKQSGRGSIVFGPPEHRGRRGKELADHDGMVVINGNGQRVAAYAERLVNGGVLCCKVCQASP